MSCFAYTAMSGFYPPYFNATLMEDGVHVSVRGPDRSYGGVYICSHEPGPGRCTKGGPNCNNYCNMHPDKSKPMADRPLPCTQHKEGNYASVVIPCADWVAMGLPLPPA